jgi:hypothetical protein
MEVPPFTCPSILTARSTLIVRLGENSSLAFVLEFRRLRLAFAGDDSVPAEMAVVFRLVLRSPSMGARRFFFKVDTKGWRRGRGLLGSTENLTQAEQYLLDVRCARRTHAGGYVDPVEAGNSPLVHPARPVTPFPSLPLCLFLYNVPDHFLRQQRPFLLSISEQTDRVIPFPALAAFYPDEDLFDRCWWRYRGVGSSDSAVAGRNEGWFGRPGRRAEGASIQIGLVQLSHGGEIWRGMS